MQRIKPLHGKKSLLPGDRIRFSNVCAHNLPYLKEVSPSRWLTIKSVNVGRGKFFPHPPIMLFRVVEVNQSFYKGRQRENIRFQPGDESRLGRPLL